MEERPMNCGCALCRLRTASDELDAAQEEARRERSRFEELLEEFRGQRADACLPRIADGLEAATNWTRSEAPLAVRVRRRLGNEAAHVSAAGAIVADCERATTLFQEHAQECRDLSRRFRRARAVIHAGQRLEIMGHFAVTKAFLRQADAATDLAHLQIVTTVGRVRTHQRAEQTIFETFKARQATSARHLQSLEKVFGPLQRHSRPAMPDQSSASWEESRALHDALARLHSELRSRTGGRAETLRRAAERHGLEELRRRVAALLKDDPEKARTLVAELEKRRSPHPKSGEIAAVDGWRSVIEVMHPKPAEEPAEPEDADELGGDAILADAAAAIEAGAAEIGAEQDAAERKGRADSLRFCGRCKSSIPAATAQSRCPLCGSRISFYSDCRCGARTFWRHAANEYRCARCGQQTKLVCQVEEDVAGVR